MKITMTLDWPPDTIATIAWPAGVDPNQITIELESTLDPEIRQIRASEIRQLIERDWTRRPGARLAGFGATPIAMVRAWMIDLAAFVGTDPQIEQDPEFESERGAIY
jgi:hypothetical protein